MEVGMEMEDDVFFADLNRQISLLIMDDDEDPNAHCPSASLQVLHHLLLFSQFNQKKRSDHSGIVSRFPQLDFVPHRSFNSPRFDWSRIYRLLCLLSISFRLNVS